MNKLLYFIGGLLIGLSLTFIKCNVDSPITKDKEFKELIIKSDSIKEEYKVKIELVKQLPIKKHKQLLDSIIKPIETDSSVTIKENQLREINIEFIKFDSVKAINAILEKQLLNRIELIDIQRVEIKNQQQTITKQNKLLRISKYIIGTEAVVILLLIL